LAWTRFDLEQRIGFRGGRFTRVNNWLTMFMGIALTVAFFAALSPFTGSHLNAMFTQRGPTQYATVFLSAWSLSILFVKWRKLGLQQKALAYDVIPPAHDFVLSAATVEQVVERVYATVDDPKHFVLFNRIMIALSNLRNLGRVSDVDDILRSQADHEGSIMETSYAVLRGFVWAIPVLGFIGTVLGLSEAIGGFGKVLSSSSELSEIASSLRGVTGGLSTAFETTLVALIAALGIQILLIFLKKSEEEFLDSCSEYCLRQVVGRLRIMPFEMEKGD
jgi:biopolymer transport protein ExbB/TolQ